MRLRACLIASAGLNLALGIGWYVTSTSSQPQVVQSVGTNTNKVITRIRNSVVVRAQNFTWQEVESDDYVTYISNLRTIGCPEVTIRDIIIADVNQLYARRKATEVISPDYEWWKSEPDTNLVQKATSKLKELEDERKALLTKLLGPDWNSDPNALPQMVRLLISLSGPVLGDLSPQTKQNVYNISLKTQEKIDAYEELQRQQSKPIDPAEEDRIRDSSRSELATILKPAELEEYLLRYSKTARSLRDDLRGYNLSADDFRTLFRACDSIDTQAAYQYTGDDPDKLKEKQALESKREEALKTALGEDRYAVYKINQDPVFRDARSTVENLGVSAEQVMPVYQINTLTQNEMDRIRNDDSLTSDEKVEALAAAQVEQHKALEKILGAEAFDRWLQSQK